MIRVCHVITGLNTGGAEMMLYKLMSAIDRATFECDVVSLLDAGPVAERIRALGVPVRSLGMRRGAPSPHGLVRLARWMRQDPPDVVQTWLYHADLVGGLASRLAGGAPVAWNIRQSTLDPRGNKRSTIWTGRVCAWLSRWLPTRIVCCSEASARLHTALGYASERMIVIPNGFDLAAFRPDPAARRAVRAELGVPDQAPLVGLVARFDPHKDHRVFAAAAGRLAVRRPDVHFVLCGDGIVDENARLVGWLRAAGVRERCHLLGRRDDTPRLNAALDLAASSSYGEGFPNVLGEAMACGVPCVATDVGDSALIDGDTGRVVPPRDPDALADAWEALLALEPSARAALGLAARQRVEAQFSLPTVVRRYETLYEELAAATRPGQPARCARGMRHGAM
jgi:glycosyltransferase involved in cell wall biosynthesis